MLYKIDKSGEVMADISEESIESLPSPEELEDMERKKKLKQINMFAKQVVDKMTKNGIPSSPSNFLIYFEKYLDEKSPVQKESIEEVLDLEGNDDAHKDYLTKIDSYLKTNFEETKNLLEDVNTLYNKANKIINFIKVKGLELAKNPTKSNITAFENKISSALSSLEKQQDEIKDDYVTIANLMKSFNKESIFDKKYEVYNKKYFFDVLKAEIENQSSFSYKNSIISLSVKKEILKDVKLQSDRDIIIKTVAKMILDRSRRSDILAHYEDGIFLLMLKHTDYVQAQKAVDSIKNFVSFSNFIIDGKQIQAKIDTNIVELDKDLSVDENIGMAIEGLLNG